MTADRQPEYVVPRHEIDVTYHADTGGNDGYSWRCRKCFRDSGIKFWTADDARVDGEIHEVEFDQRDSLRAGGRGVSDGISDNSPLFPTSPRGSDVTPERSETERIRETLNAVIYQVPGWSGPDPWFKPNVEDALEALAVLERQLAEKDEALRAIIAKSEQSAHLPAHDRNVIESIARSGLKA